MQVSIPVAWSLFQPIQGLQQLDAMARRNSHLRVRPDVNVLIQRCVHESIFNVKLMNLPFKNRADSQEHTDRCILDYLGKRLLKVNALLLLLTAINN